MTIVLGLMPFGMAAIIYWDADKRARRGELTSVQRKIILFILFVQIFCGLTLLSVN